MTTMSGIAETGGIRKRVEDYKASKTVVFWSCIACVTAAITLGFTWGGWVTGSSAMAMADRAASKAASSGQATLAAAICVDRFVTGPHAQVQTALLKATEAARRSDFLRQGGWLTLPGMKDPVPGAAQLCVEQILGATSSD